MFVRTVIMQKSIWLEKAFENISESSFSEANSIGWFNSEEEALKR